MARFLGRTVALGVVSLLGVMAPGCVVEDTMPVTPPEAIADHADPISAADVLARARSWVQVAMPYCGGVNGGKDYICGGTCVRTGAAKSPEWDPYRSDCSGLVSYSWGLKAPGLDTGSMGTIANQSTGAFKRIEIDDLQPGDALVTVTKGHTFLFAGWVTKGKRLRLIEEYDCGKVAREVERDVTISGNTLKKSGDSRAYLAAHLNAMTASEPVTPPVTPTNQPPTGSLDRADCALGIEGWAQDPDAKTATIDVHLFFDGVAGAGYGVKLTANRTRDDLCGPLGSCNHGFGYRAPLSLFDGKDHTVHAYGIDSAGGTNPLLAGAPRTLRCDPAVPSGQRRWITSVDSLATWRFDRFESELPLGASAADAIAMGADLPAAPVLWKAPDEARVWLIDSGFRRAVENPESMAAWHFDWSAIVEKPASAIDALPEGPAVRPAPVLVAADSQGRITLLDDPLPTTGAGGSGAGGSGAAGAGQAGAAGSDPGAGGSDGLDLPSPDEDGGPLDPDGSGYDNTPSPGASGSAGAGGRKSSTITIQGDPAGSESSCAVTTAPRAPSSLWALSLGALAGALLARRRR